MKSLFTNFFWFIRDYWFRANNKLAWSILAILIGLGFGIVHINVLITEWSKGFYDTLFATTEASTIYGYISEYLLYVGIFIFASVARAWLRKLLIIKWRSYLTDQFLGNWFDKRAYYRIALKQTTDNPDQRIADDINIFVSRTIELFISLLVNLAQLYSFSQILWRLSGTHTFNLFGSDYTISGYLVWVVIIYAVLGTVFTQVIGHRLHALNYAQQKFEADFRASLVRKHDNAEQIALYNGEQREISSLHGEFGSIIKNWKTIMNAELRLGLFTTGYDRFALMLPVLASVPLIIAKVLTLGSLMQIRNAFSAVFNSISWFVFAYSILPEWSATIQRLSQFRHSITQEQARDKAAQTGEGLQMTGLNLYTPQGEPILQNVHAHIAPRKWTQLAGQSGLGKSTLLRTIGGLWVDYDGEWQRPHGSSLLLPQKAYLGKGTLAEILSYPRAINPNADYAAVLHDIGLPKYTEQLHETNINWAQTLSAGEQQRIAIARALLAAPDYLYLDENTSALDLPTARHLLQLLKNRLPNSTVVIVSHQSELNDLFDEVLDLSAFRAK